MQLLKIITNNSQRLVERWRKRASSQRLSHRESETLYRTLIESSLDGMILTRNFSILYCNRVFLEMLGYERDEIYRIDPTQILAAEDRDRVLAYHQQRMHGEVQNQNYAAAFIRKDGSRFMAELNATTVHLKGKPTSLITMRDITQRLKLQQQLEQSMQRFRDLAEMLPQTVYELDGEGRQIYINKAGIQMFGHHDDGTGHLAYESIAPEDHERMRENMKKSMQKDKDYTIGNEYTARRVDTGERFPVIVYAAPIIENDEVVGTRGIIIDISERKRMEETIRESEQKYKALVENSQSSILIIRDNRLLFANNTYFQLLGYKKEELLALPAISTIVEEDRWKALRIAERRKARDFTTIKEFIRMYTSNGEIRECECLATVIEYEGIPASFMTLHDVTETKRMQEALTKSERRFRELTEMLPQAVYELDVNGVPTFMNKTGREMFMLGDTSQMSNKKAHDFFSPQDKQKMQLALEREAKSIVMIDGEPKPQASRPVEYTAYRSDGSSFPVIIYGVPIFENGNVIGSRGIIVDISEQKAIENTLRESEEKYRLLFEAESDAIFMIDAETGQILDVNPAATRTYGYSREELLQMKNIDVSAEPDKTQQSTNRRETKVLVRYHKKKDGSILPVELSAGFTVFRGQKIQIVTARDITENKKMQDALRESENKYKLLVESSQDGILMLQGESIKYANAAICRMLGYELHEILERSVFDYLEPSYIQKGNDVLQRRLEGDNSTINMDFHFRNKHGKMIEAETISSIIDFNGERVAFYTIHDITERNRMQTELRESEEKYRTLVDNANDGIVLTQNGLLKLANKAMCDFLLYSLDELVEQPFYRFVFPDDQAEMAAYHSRRMAHEQFNVLYRSRLIRKDGKVITVELNARTLYYNNQPAAFIIVRDITERLAIENELKAAKGELEILNKNLESRVQESSRKLAETHTQLIALQKENIQSQFDVLRQQVNPHFLFNSLNVLTSLIKIEPDLAEQFSEHLSKVYRYVLENKDDELVSLSTELRFLDAYIFLLNIRFVDKIKFNIVLPDETHSRKIIPLAMQLLIENAIKHNIMTKSAPLYIDIFIDNNNFLNIINNLQERPSQIVSTGVGLKNIENRYLLLNNTKPVFTKTETHFIAQVPLVE